MFLKFNEFKYTNIIDINEISVEKRDLSYIVYMRRGGGSEIIFTSQDKSKVDLFISKLFEMTKECVVDIGNIIYDITPPEVTKLTVQPKKVYENDEVTITINFNAPVKQVSEITFNVESKMTVKTPLALSPDKMSATAVYTATSSGECPISVKVTKGQVVKHTIVNIEAHPEITVVTATPQTVVKGGDVTIAISLDLPITSPSEVIITTDDKLELKTPLALDVGKRNLTATYTTKQSGQSNVTVKTVEGITTKSVTITINEQEVSPMKMKSGPWLSD